MKASAIRKNYIPSLDNLPYMMTLDMVAGLTGLNYETVKRHCQKGVIKAVKIGREWRVKKDDFQKIGENPQI